MKSSNKVYRGGEISLWLDSYDDIYSDFDSRNYLKRRVSEDFIDELKAALTFGDDGYPEDLVLSIPANLRKKEIEGEIVTNIKRQFHRYLEQLDGINRRNLFKGRLFLGTGVIIMGIDSVIAYWVKITYPTVLLRVILEPAGWFLIWNSFDLLLSYYKSIRGETLLHKKMDQLHIRFKTTEE